MRIIGSIVFLDNNAVAKNENVPFPIFDTKNGPCIICEFHLSDSLVGSVDLNPSSLQLDEFYKCLFELLFFGEKIQ